MSRCKACNKVLDENELVPHPDLQDELEDLCIPCRHISYESLLDIESEEELLDIVDSYQEALDSSL